jgi:hypothetical protein
MVRRKTHQEYATFLIRSSPTFEHNSRAKRRCIMLKYCYSHAAFRQPANTEPIMNLPPTPNYEHFAWEGKVETDTLTQRQRQIVLYPPYARGRGPVS